ncbi:MAG TPA: DNA polymerase I, partial [Bacteroidales bacterium]|nr:DNA polymerase I [Bacteroidales bacterium]
QLLTSSVVMVKPSRSGADIETVTAADLCKKYGIENPMQFKDILALWGDSSDNIPGVPGIGEKTAAKLIAKYGSIEEIYKHIDELSKGQREKLLENREQLDLARILVEIKTDVPVDIDFDKLARAQPNAEELKKLFEELEFRSLSRDIFGDAKTQSKPKPIQTSLFGDDVFAKPITEHSLNTIDDVKHDYRLVDSDKEIDELVRMLSATDEFCFDTETTGLEHHTSKLVGISFSIEPHTAWFVPIPADDHKANEIVNRFKPVFEDENIAKVGQNIKFDLLMLKYYGIELRGKL